VPSARSLSLSPPVVNMEFEGNKVFVGGMSWATTSEGLREHFEKFGGVVSTTVATDRQTGKPRGFGFVTFADAETIDKVMPLTHIIDTKNVELKRAVQKGMLPPPSNHNPAMARTGRDSADERKIFVGGVSLQITAEDMKEYFGRFAPVEDARIMVNRDTGHSRGFGFVTFCSVESVEEVMHHRHALGGRSVEIKRAQSTKRKNNAISTSGPGGPIGDKGGFGGSGYGLIYGAFYECNPDTALGKRKHGPN